MRHVLRFFVLALALCLIGFTAALLQAWLHRRTLDRLHRDLPARESLVYFESDQHQALAILMGVTFISLLAVALTPARSPENHRATFTRARQEMAGAEQLARTTALQGAALERERDARQRVEASLQLQQKIVNQTLEDKVRLGRDLHDGIIQSLYATGLTLESARESLPDRPQLAADRVQSAMATINATIRDIRNYIAGLSPASVRKDNFVATLHAVAAEIRADRPVDFDFNLDDSAAARVTADQLLHLIPVVREAVSNALRHGAATRVTFRLHEGDNELCLLVQDNGRGFDPASATLSGGNGLANLRARAEAIGGTLQLTSAAGEGARLVITLPIHA